MTLTDADFQEMTGHPPYPSHVIDLSSFEEDWPKISAAFHGYATRSFVSEQAQWIDEAMARDRAALSSELTRSYQSLTKDWEQFGVEASEHAYAGDTATEFIAFQNRLWASRRLMWLADDLRCLAEGTEALFTALRARISHFK